MEQRRLQLSATLEAQIADPNSTAEDRRTAARLLAVAVNKPWAHQKLLDAHSAQLRQQQDSLLKPQHTGDPLGVDCNLHKLATQMLAMAVTLRSASCMHK